MTNTLIRNFIAHRGNVNGVNQERENTWDYILEALNQKYHAEIDIWLIDDTFYLGHDYPKPRYTISEEELYKHKDELWIHCKNVEALRYLKTEFNCFSHDSDKHVLTSNGYIWTYPGEKLLKGSIAVIRNLDFVEYTNEELKQCHYICTDNITKMEKDLNVD